MTLDITQIHDRIDQLKTKREAIDVGGDVNETERVFRQARKTALTAEIHQLENIAHTIHTERRE